MLRRRIDSCKGVVQLVGKCYGAEPPRIDQQFGRVSYTQYEALYALSKGKKVWYLFLDEGFPTDSPEAEDEEKRKLQSDYRDRVKADSHLYHPLNSREGLEASVLKLRDDLTRLRRGVKRWAAFVAVLLVLSVGLSVWVLQGQRQANEEQRQSNQQLLAKVDKILLLQGVNAYAEVQNKVRDEWPQQKPQEIEERTYEELGKQLGIDPNTLKEQLPRFAEELKKSSNATTYERANAAYVAKDYAEAERLALAAADEAQRASSAKKAEAIKALELAGWAAEKRIDYAGALTRLRDAEKLTDRTGDALQWARVQFAIAWVLQDQGQYRDAEHILREVLKQRESTLGPEHPDTLITRHRLATALYFEGEYAIAESEYRAVIVLQEKVLGPEHPDTLATRHNLAGVLYHQAKYAEAEMEYRKVIELKEKVLGAENPDTLKTRIGLGNALYYGGRLPEAEAEYRSVLKLTEKVLGSEHPQTLGARQNLAMAMTDEGKFAEAEPEYRAVIKIEEKVLGPEHPDTLATRDSLAKVLTEQGKFAEAEAEFRATIELQAKVVGPENPDTLETRTNLMELLDDQGRHAEAETEGRVVIKLEEKVLGPEHIDTLASRTDLGNSLCGQGKYAEAEAEYHTALRLQEKVLGPEHLDVLKTCFNLAVCLRSENQLQEAIALAQRAADGARKVLGPDHPDSKKYEKLFGELRAAGGVEGIGEK